MADDFNVVDVPDGKAISGTTFYEVSPDSTTYSRKFGRETLEVPTVPYCPACSQLHEYDKRWGEVKPKRITKASDFVFDVGYERDEKGDYAKCRKCGHDFRERPPEPDITPTKSGGKHPLLREKVMKPPAKEVYEVGIAEYRDGYFVVGLSEFKKTATVGYAKGKNITPAVDVAGDRYTIEFAKFVQFWKDMSTEDGDFVGIPRIYWVAV